MKTLLQRLLAMLRSPYDLAVDQQVAARLTAKAQALVTFKMKNTYRFDCFDSNGKLKWSEEVPNLVVDVGINDLLDKYFKGSSYTAAFYVGLVDNGSFSAIAAGDTMSSHTGWLESAVYSNATRPALTLGSVSAKSVDNSASQASFTINSTGTVNGAFVTTNSTKSGTTGTLYGAASFSGTRAVISGDVLNVTVTLTGS